jgi:hypothetical protein
MAQPDRASKPGDGSRPSEKKPTICTDLDSLQVFEDRDTRGNPLYPPVKQPRVLPKDMRPHRPAQET